MPIELSNRQVHLDFHTSGLIENVAAEFNADEFIETLKQAGVEEICVFARCHHGYCYYPTKTGTVYPHLKHPDLMGEQLAALKDAGIRAGIYTTICWAELSADEHPDWICKKADGNEMKLCATSGEEVGLEEAGWRFVCWNSPYREWLKTHVQEILESYTADFLFLDILFTSAPCRCEHCVARMKEHGLDPANPADAEKNSIDSAREFMAEINAVVYGINPNIATFYNSRLRVTGVVEDGSRPELDDLGMLCIESLPSGPWGYDHFPLFAKYFQNIEGKPLMGHTGKFQKMWGDFGGLKNQAALDYEMMRMMAHGICGCVGDQLHPNGKLDKATYELIGNTFNKVKGFEDVLIPSRPIDEIGVLFTNQPKVARNVGTHLEAETGAMKLLTQLQYQFSFLDEQSDFTPYKLLILPDEVTIAEVLKQKLDDYLKSGGRLLLSNASGLDRDGCWCIDEMSIDVKGDHPFSPYYIYPAEEMKGVVVDTEHVMYLGGKAVEVLDSSYSMPAKIANPYFNRTAKHFCSHAQTPPEKRTDAPEMVFNNRNIVYFASPLFTCYNQYSPKAVKQMADWAIRQLIGEKLIESNLPSTAEVTWRKNGAGRKVLTILHYVPQRRGYNLDIVEDVIPLVDVEISLPADNARKVVDQLVGEELDFTVEASRLKVNLPRIEGFAVITVE
ncbi:MAG: alpha-amylase family protein [Verrucomicrobiota bacterium]